MFNALVGLPLSGCHPLGGFLRLSSLLRLSCVLFCRFPTRGLAACRYFYSRPPRGTLHSFRAGLAITLALSGGQLAYIMEHVGWRLAHTASHYLKVEQVLRPGGPSELLSRHDSSAQALADSYTDLNSLLHFTVTFPTGVSP